MILKTYAHSDDPYLLNRIMNLIKCGLNAKVNKRFYKKNLQSTKLNN